VILFLLLRFARTFSNCRQFFSCTGGDLLTVTPFQTLFSATEYTSSVVSIFSREYFHFSFIPPQIDQTQRRIQLANNPASDVTLET
jgi:hypothetical protein